MSKNKYLLFFFLIIVGYLLFWQIGPISSNKVTNNAASNVVIQKTPSPSRKIINVKYREDTVDLNSGDFEHLSTSSSFVNGLWYDQSNKYMIILLNSTYYHYCSLPLAEWRSFKSADSYGTYYNQRIKGNYDCKSGYVPSY